MDNEDSFRCVLHAIDELILEEFIQKDPLSVVELEDNKENTWEEIWEYFPNISINSIMKRRFEIKKERSPGKESGPESPNNSSSKDKDNCSDIEEDAVQRYGTLPKRQFAAYMKRNSKSPNREGHSRLQHRSPKTESFGRCKSMTEQTLLNKMRKQRLARDFEMEDIDCGSSTSSLPKVQHNCEVGNTREHQSHPQTLTKKPKNEDIKQAPSTSTVPSGDDDNWDTANSKVYLNQSYQMLEESKNKEEDDSEEVENTRQHDDQKTEYLNRSHPPFFPRGVKEQSVNNSSFYTPHRRHTRRSDNRLRRTPSDKPTPMFQYHQLLGDSQFVRFSEQLLHMRCSNSESGPRRIGYCVSGQTIGDLKDRLLNKEFKLANKVIIMIGTNDVVKNTSPDEMIRNYNAIVEFLLPNVEMIVLLTVPPVPKISWQARHWHHLVKLNNHIKTLKNDKTFVVDVGGLYVSLDNSIMTDLYEPVYAKSNRADLMHLNKKGLALLRAFLCIQYFDNYKV